MSSEIFIPGAHHPKEAILLNIDPHGHVPAVDRHDAAVEIFPDFRGQVASQKVIGFFFAVSFWQVLIL